MRKTKYEILEDKINDLKSEIKVLKNRVTDIEYEMDPIEYEDSDFIIAMKKVEKSLNDNSRKHLLELITAFQVYQKYL